MERDLISVVVPVYNVETYLRICLDSIINQTYKNLEIILVDDGSTDNSGKICDEYAEKDSRIKVIHKKNEGVSSARNTGLHIAKGEYISFVDSDDVIHNKMILKLYENLIEFDADISCCGFKAISDYNDIDLSNAKSNSTEKIQFTGNDTINVFLYNKNFSPNSIWGKLYRRHLFETIRFPQLKTAEDFCVSFALLLNSKKVCIENVPLYSYYLRQNSLTHSKLLPTADTIKACKLLKEHCEINISDENILNVCKKMLLLIESRTILENYYLTVKRKLGKEEEEKHKSYYYAIKKELKKFQLISIPYRIFEFSPKIFAFMVEVFYRLKDKNI